MHFVLVVKLKNRLSEELENSYVAPSTAKLCPLFDAAIVHVAIEKPCQHDILRTARARV